MTTPSERAERIAGILDELRRNLKGSEVAARVVGMDMDDPATGYRGDPDFYRRNAAIAKKVRARLDALESLLSERDALAAQIERLRAVANISDRMELIDRLEAERERNRVEIARLRSLLTLSADPECAMSCAPNDPEFGGVCVVRRSYFDAQIDEIFKLRSLLEEAREALRPFAGIAAAYEREGNKCHDWHNCSVDVADLRRAAAWLKRAEEMQ